MTDRAISTAAPTGVSGAPRSCEPAGEVGAVHRRARARIPTPHGELSCLAYEAADGNEHLAFVAGDVTGGADVLVRLHSECLTGDVLDSLRCDCGRQLDESLRLIAAAGAGGVVYLRGHEGRGIGIAAKLRAYQLQDRGLDTVDANLALGLPVDRRDYAAGVAILRVTGVRLLTNNPDKVRALARYGIHVTARVPLVITPNDESLRYLQTKRSRMGHLLDGIDETG